MKRQKKSKLTYCVAAVLAASLVTNYAALNKYEEVNNIVTMQQNKLVEYAATVARLESRLLTYGSSYVVPSPVPRRYLDVPLDKDLQSYIWSLCYNYDIVDYYELIYAVIEVESNFNPLDISETNDYGLMQINVVNHEHLADVLGVTDFLDPYQNVHCGVYLLSLLLHKYSVDDALMAYNMGEYGASKLWSRGIHTTAYVNAVMEDYTKYI